MLYVCEIICVKTSRKVHSNRPPSSRSISRQQLNRLTDAAMTARPPSVFNKNPLLPPIGKSAAAAAALSPGSDSSASVPLDLSATPAAERWSRMQCSRKGASVSPLASSVTATPNADDCCALAAAAHPHHQSRPTEVPVVETDSQLESRHSSVAAIDQQRTECPSLRPDDALEGEPSSQTSALAVKLTRRQSSCKATASTDAAVAQCQPDCSFSSPKLKSEDIVDLPAMLPASARLTVTDAACQCDELSSGGSGTRADGDDNKHLLASAAGRDDIGSSAAHPRSSGKPASVDWWSTELVSTTSILGFSPSPTHRRLCSGAGSRTAAARKFHGLNAHEMQTVSSVLNTLARSQSRAAATPATPITAAALSTAEPPRVPTTERLRLTVRDNHCRLLA